MEKLNFRGVARVNESVHPDFLPINEVPELTNLVLDREGKKNLPTSRGAMTSFNANEGGAQAMIGLEDVSDSEGRDFLLATSGDKLLSSQGGRTFWTTLISGQAPSKAFRLTAVGNGTYIASNGQNMPYLLSGAYFNQVNPLIIPRMNVQSIGVSITSGGELAQNGIYRYIFAYVTENGEVSEMSLPVTYFRDTGTGYYKDQYTTDTLSRTVVFSSIPASSDPRVTGIRLYRTKNNQKTYYLAATLENGTQTYIDSLSDDQLDTTLTVEYLGTPASMKYMCFHRGRVWGANVVKDYHNAVPAPAKSNVQFRATSVTTYQSGMLQGRYRFAISYVDSDGRESELSPYAEYYMDYSTGQWLDGTCRIDTSGWPLPRIGANGLDKNIVSVNFYVTQADERTPFYYVDTVGVTELQKLPESLGVLSLSQLSGETYPIKSKVYSDPASLKSGLIYSDVNRPSMFLQENVILVYPDGSDEVTGILDDQDGVLIFKKYSINKIFTSQGSPVTWVPVRISSSIGCTEPDTLVQASGSAYFVHNKEVWKYTDGTFRNLSEGKQKSLSLVSRFKAACYFSFRQWYCLICQDAYGDVVFCYDEKLDCWYEFRNLQASSGYPSFNGIYDVAEKRYGAYANTLIFGRMNELSFYDEKQTLDKAALGGDTPITSALTTKTFSFQDDISKARIRHIHVRYNALRSDGQVAHSLMDMDSLDERYITEAANTSGEVRKMEVEQLSGIGCQSVRRLRYRILGSIGEFLSVVVSYNTINRGSRD